MNRSGYTGSSVGGGWVAESGYTLEQKSSQLSAN